MVLWEKDGISVNEITEKLILNTNTVTPLLKRMEAMQLITRTPSTVDQRKIIIQLTSQGLAMRESAAEIPLKLMNKLNLEVSDVQIAEALHLKNKLYELIKVLDKSSN
jgi:DNA-binding MarR family transcriptional regulator